MKNTFKVLGIIALMAVIGFSMAACGGDDGSTGPDLITFKSTDTAGNTYNLIITPTKSNEIATGNSYELTIKSGQTSKLSKGTITFVTGSGALTMQPRNSGSETFTVTVTNSGQMTNISGTIAVEGGETVTGPGQVTPEGGGGGGGNVGTFLNGKWAATSPDRYLVVSGDTWTYYESSPDGYTKGTWSSTVTPAANTTGTLTLTITQINSGGWTSDLPSIVQSVKTNTATFTINAAGNQITITNPTYTTGGVWGTLAGTYTKQ